MKKKNAIFRNEFDYLITDTLPAEMPAPFSYASFYRWLTDNSSNYGDLMRKAIKDTKEESKYPGAKYGSFPHRFYVKKKNGSSRMLSCPSILGAILMTSFISRYQKDVLYDFTKPSFSIRKHKANSSLMYVGTNGKGKHKVIHYISDQDSAENELLEKTGMFFDIRPMHNLSRLWKSNIWVNSWKKFANEKCLHVDIENCFPSIYTHSLGWVFPHEGAESKAFNNSGDYHNIIEHVIQRTNANETHGIPVGPEFSRLAAETLLEEIDRRVILKLESKYRLDIDYRVLRFVDDFYIFGKNELVRNDVLDCIEKECRPFFLRLNHNKKEELLNDENPEWMMEISTSLKYYDELIKAANPSVSRKMFLSQITYFFHSIDTIIQTHENKNANSMVPYVLACFSRKFKSRKDCKRLFSLNCSSCGFYEKLFEFLFCTCGKAARFYNIQNLVLMINNIVVFTPSNKQRAVKNAIEKVLMNENTKNWIAGLLDGSGIYDIMPLLLELSAIEVKIPKDLFDNFYRVLEKTHDPIILACGILICDKTKRVAKQLKLVDLAEKSIIAFNSGFYLERHFKNAFLFPDIWYLFIFNKYKKITPTTQAIIDTLLATLKTKVPERNNDIVSLVCDYMMDDKYKVFDWDFFSKQSQRKWHYVTNKRTNLIKGDFYQ